jgi:hypothetical protein
LLGRITVQAVHMMKNSGIKQSKVLQKLVPVPVANILLYSQDPLTRNFLWSRSESDQCHC